MTCRSLFIAAAMALALAACSKPHFSADKQYGANAPLPNPVQYLFPPMGIAKPIGWKNGEMPTVPAGFTITPFATDLKTPRRVLPLANGDVLVVESSGPNSEPVLRPKDVVFGIVIGVRRRRAGGADAVTDMQKTMRTGVVPDDVEEMITYFQVNGIMYYVDAYGEPLGFEDVFTKIDMCREHYARVGLGEDYVDQFIR